MTVRVSKAEAKAMGLSTGVPPNRWKKKNKGKRGDPPTDAAQQSHGLKLFLAACKAHGVPEPIEEYEFCPGRKWRFDYCWADFDLALEVQGGLFNGGRHVRGPALLEEHEKLNEAAVRGWRILFCTPAAVDDGSIFPIIKRAVDGE